MYEELIEGLFVGSFVVAIGCAALLGTWALLSTL
mgnify:CR=1 FL=1|jgi:hypothetical protein